MQVPPAQFFPLRLPAGARDFMRSMVGREISVRVTHVYSGSDTGAVRLRSGGFEFEARLQGVQVRPGDTLFVRVMQSESGYQLQLTQSGSTAGMMPALTLPGGLPSLLVGWLRQLMSRSGEPSGQFALNTAILKRWQKASGDQLNSSLIDANRVRANAMEFLKDLLRAEAFPTETRNLLHSLLVAGDHNPQTPLAFLHLWTVGENAAEQNDSEADSSKSGEQESAEFLSMAGDLGAQPAYVVLNLKLSGLDILQSLVVGHTSDFQEVGVYISTVNGKLHQALQ
ncbi:MAG: hypothetical protein KDK27_18420, partial [Leptospiraceae bacterium]|nr:hypothetical protein [Leptospiraceae bacterium]